ncbi:OmpA family protein [Terrimonas pollutisoli]|uniref:OmpA family protein n=1 Tax=Terrimonas pollutisoli TaxID=3034147 RepID=UPI0023EB4D31|nr:OmpA family protein [Terrimonas sp. H1YJ31]
MALDLADAAKNLLPGDLVAKAANSLGESESSIQKAIGGAIPSVLAGMLNKSSSTSEGEILDLAKTAAGSGILSNLSGLFDSSVPTADSVRATVMGWLRSLFGDKLNNIINAIAGFAGIKSSSANTVLSMAVPAALAPVGQYATENNLSESGLNTFLQSQKNDILSAVPSGLNLTGALGIASLDDIGGKVTHAIPSATAHAGGEFKTATSSVSQWRGPFILVVVVAVLIWFFSKRGCTNEGTSTATDDTAHTTLSPVPPVSDPDLAKTSGGTLDTVTGNYVYDTGQEIELKLADGTILKVGDNSTEAKLFNMLSNAAWTVDTVDKTKNWVSFDRVYFESGKSVLTAASQTQVKNVAIILKNFPSGSIKIGGYTDNVGDAAVNKKISDARAKAVMKELISMGAGAKQITEAIGYGPEHPVCAANDTPECKAQNRRVDLKVASK